MKRMDITPLHLEKLAQYNLQALPAWSYQAVCYETGEKITAEGAEIGQLAIVVSGVAKVCRTAPNGKTLILCYYLSDGVIGEIELLTKQSIATTTVTAISAFACVLVDMRVCAAEAGRNVLFLQALGVALAQKLDKSGDSCMSAALCTAEERLCQYILHNAPRDIFADPLTDAACSVGTSYRHLLRILARLCAEGVLQRTPQGFRVMDRAALTARAGTA